MAATSERPRGILAIWHDIAPGWEGEVLAWYDREHHFERLDVPGFLGVRRYTALGSGPRLFIRYETVDAAVLGSAAYLARVNAPTPGTLRAQPQFRNNSRTVCRRLARFGRAEGGVVATLRLAGTEGWAWRDAATLLERRGILAAEVWEADAERSAIASNEKRLRGVADAHVAAVLVVHASDPAAAEAAAAAALASLPDSLRAGAQHDLYALSFAAEGVTCA